MTREKLVRDRYGELPELQGRLRFARPEELPKLFRKKFWEEFKEVCHAKDGELAGELADLKEVSHYLHLHGLWKWYHDMIWMVFFVGTINTTTGLSEASVEYHRQCKRGEYGAFDFGLVLRLQEADADE